MSPPSPDTAYSLQRLFDLVRRLRAPDGCPWDRDQRIEDLRAYLVEEAHEVAAAIDRQDWPEMAVELGDLLFQIVFVACLAEEQRKFSFDQVIDEIEQKMVSRHPHVFGEERLADADEVHQAWERRKLAEKGAEDSHLAGLPESLPALLASYRMTQKAAGVGFDWPDAEAVLDKVDEELAELRSELASSDSALDRPAIADELGDLLLTLANLSRHLGLDPESVLARANAKFRRRFRQMERNLTARQISLGDLDMAALEAAWNQAKKDERS